MESVEKVFWDFFRSKGLNEYGAASLMAYIFSDRERTAEYCSASDIFAKLEGSCESISEVYPSVWRTLHYAKTILEASNAMTRCEHTKDRGMAAPIDRVEMSQEYYEKFKDGGALHDGG